MSSNTPALFQPVKIGALTLQHRIVHAPLTRFRNTKDNVPQTVMTEYYSQRAGIPGTLIIAESTFIAQKAGLYYNAPGIWNDAQIAGWKEVNPDRAERNFTRAASDQVVPSRSPMQSIPKAQLYIFNSGL